jgi:hypothetical protein
MLFNVEKSTKPINSRHINEFIPVEEKEKVVVDVTFSAAASAI